MHCSLCNGNHAKIISNTDAKTSAPLNVFLCESCGFIQQYPIPNSEELKQYYSVSYRMDYKKTHHPKSKHVYRSAGLALDRLAYLRKAGVTGGKLLDIGAGSGEFVALACRAGFDAEGIEPNQGYSEYARSEYQVRLRTEGLDEIDGKYDVITMFHVLEHLRSPVEVFERVHALLKPGGKLFIEVPWALSSATSPSNRYFKAHLYYFDKETLSSCASQLFDPVSTCVESNLRALFEPRSHPRPLVIPSSEYVSMVREHLGRQGWVTYLTIGKGFFKPVTKLKNAFKEWRVRKRSGRSILDESPAFPR
ncbi:MAG: class I SAM-dependent methyltransferase [Gloeobacteraceae cyanobacterium ES-bin-144]|nr:class I SAM-dependent methyltransferase [Verrucomicrobiales bacterium]